MAWDLFDFAVFGAMVVGAGLGYRLLARRSQSATYRYAAGIAVAAAFLLVWANGAVGIIGDETNDANLMFFGVLAVGVAGAVLARFRPRGMARALCATALAQLLVAVIALAAGLGSSDPLWPRDILMISALFTALWLASAGLFRKAAVGQPPRG